MYTFKDIPELLKSDRRFMAAGGFLAVAVFVWIATSPWREVEKPKEHPERMGKQTEYYYEPMQNFNVEIDQHRKEVSELHEEIKRSSSEIATGRQEFEWHTNKLMDRLNGMSSQLEEITAKVGASRLNSTRTNKNIDKSTRKAQRIR
jgi:uncharacterized coiled-coil DUF342 family protein